MRGISISILFVAFNFIFQGCEKEAKTNNLLPDIIGKWKLNREQTGMIPTINYSPGNENIIEFSELYFRAFSNGQLTSSGQYKIIIDSIPKKGECRPPGKYRVIYNYNFQNPKELVKVSGNTLIFLSGCFALDYGSYKEYLRK